MCGVYIVIRAILGRRKYKAHSQKKAFIFVNKNTNYKREFNTSIVFTNKNITHRFCFKRFIA